jgi:hypothetical protein
LHLPPADLAAVITAARFCLFRFWRSNCSAIPVNGKNATCRDRQCCRDGSSDGRAVIAALDDVGSGTHGNLLNYFATPVAKFPRSPIPVFISFSPGRCWGVAVPGRRAPTNLKIQAGPCGWVTSVIRTGPKHSEWEFAMPAHDMGVGMKRCRACGGTFDEEAFFRQNRTESRFGQVYLAKHARCIGCELTARNEPTLEARALRKSRQTIQHHAEKYGMSRSEFSAQYGWDARRLAHDIKHALENTCRYCWTPYSEMGHGLDDLTFDIIDRSKPPYYHTNVSVCCRTCNTEKAKMPPDLWSRRLLGWRQWRSWMDGMKVNPLQGLPLFDCT